MAFVKRKKESKISRDFLEKEMDLCLVSTKRNDSLKSIEPIEHKKHTMEVKDFKIIDGKISICFRLQHVEPIWGEKMLEYVCIKTEEIILFLDEEDQIYFDIKSDFENLNCKIDEDSNLILEYYCRQ